MADETPEEPKKPYARCYLRALRPEMKPGVGLSRPSDILETNPDDIKRRCGDIGVVSWYRDDSMPLDLVALLRGAAACYILAQYESAITLSTGAVEMIMNKDRRTVGLDLRRIDCWATLNNRNLTLVQTVGLPVHTLLAAKESLTVG